MQAIAPVTFAQLLAAGQQPLLNFEVWVDPDWIPLNALDAKNYIESISISLGGAGMTPNPIGGAWNASLSNEDSIFHPKHPTSGYVNYLKTGMKVRIKIGAHYGVTDYYWQRLIGYIDEPRFEGAGQKVNVSGADYMKLLEDTEFKMPDNYWGTFETFSSLSSEGLLGDEIYTEENDAMTYPAEGEADNVANWTHPDCDFDSLDDGGDPHQPSDYVGQMINQVSGARVINTDVGTAEEGKEYRVRFKHRVPGGYEGPVGIQAVIKQGGAYIKPLMRYFPTDDWTEETFYFTATHDGAIEMQFWCASAITDLRLDQISIWEFIDYWDIHYQLTDTEAKGPYYVTLDDVPVWQGERDEGWYYAEEEDTGDEPHPARVLFFDANKVVANGTDNLVIHYFETTPLEDVVARILYKAKLYASEADAKTAMEYTDPEIDVDKVWFEPGTSLLDGIKKVCERCNYRFHFKWDGTPVFKPAASYTDVLTDGGLNEWDDADNLTHWSKDIAGASTVNREAAEKVEGDFSCRIDIDADNNNVNIYQTNIPLTPLKRYKIIIWYKNSAAGKTSRFYLRNTGNNVYLKEDGTWNIGANYITLPNSIVWIPYELEFYAHADYSTYLMLLREASAASSSIYFDDLSIWREEFTFSEQKHIASFTNYQDRNEIRNRIVITGMKQAEPVNKEETMPPELRGEKSDATSIDTYGERTLSIRNHLFQTQDSILNEAGDDGMCVTLLAVYKDPKLYADIEVPFNPAPLELGDMIGWKERLSPTLEVIRRGCIRDIKIDGFRTIYKCEDPT